MLAVVIEAMTVNSVEKFDNINTPFATLNLDGKASKDVSLSEILYSEKVTRGLMRLIVDNGDRTFKSIGNRKFIHSLYLKNNYMPIWFTNRGVKARKVDDLFKVISSDVTLDGKGYILKRYRYLKGQLQKDNNRDIEEELKLDISLTSLYKSYLSHHIYGDIKWWEFQNYLKRLRRIKYLPTGLHISPHIFGGANFKLSTLPSY